MIRPNHIALLLGFTLAAPAGASAQTWHLDALTPDEAFNAVAGRAANDVYAFGTEGSAFRFDGTAWNAIDNGGATNLNFAFSNGVDVYVMSESTLYRADGNSLFEVTLPTPVDGMPLMQLRAIGGGGGAVFVSGNVRPEGVPRLTRIVSITGALSPCYQSNGSAQITHLWAESESFPIALTDMGGAFAPDATLASPDCSEASSTLRMSNGLYDSRFGSSALWGPSRTDLYETGPSGTRHHDGTEWSVIDSFMGHSIGGIGTTVYVGGQISAEGAAIFKMTDGATLVQESIPRQSGIVTQFYVAEEDAVFAAFGVGGVLRLGPPLEGGSDLAASGTASVAGRGITYDVLVTNNGPDPVTDYSVTLTLPEGFTSASEAPANCDWPRPGMPMASATCGEDSAAGPVLASGESRMFAIAVNAPTGGSFDAALVVSTDHSDPDPANDQATITAEATADATADLELTIADRTGGLEDTHDVTLVVRNLGPDTAEAVTLNVDTGTLVGPIELCTVADGDACVLGTMEPGAELTVFGDREMEPAGEFLLVEVSSAATDPDPSNNSAQDELRAGVDGSCTIGAAQRGGAPLWLWLVCAGCALRVRRGGASRRS